MITWLQWTTDSHHKIWPWLQWTTDSHHKIWPWLQWTTGTDSHHGFGFVVARINGSFTKLLCQKRFSHF